MFFFFCFFFFFFFFLHKLGRETESDERWFLFWHYALVSYLWLDV